MSVDALAESVNFPNQKRRASASRSYRVKIPPSNGQTFSAGQVVQLDLPSNLAGSYANFNQCYLSFNVASSTDSKLDRCGAYGLISRCQAYTAGSQVMDLSEYNVLMTVLLDMDSGSQYKSGIGNTLLGTNGGHQEGELLEAGVARKFCLPFCLNPFAMTQPHRLIPLFSSSPIQFKLTLESVQKALIGDGTGTLTYSDFELVMQVCEMSPGTQAQIDSMCGGMYNILASSYVNVGTTMSSGDTAVTANLGISVSSLERVIVVHRPTSSLNAAASYSLGNRTRNGLKEYQIFINSEAFPARPILTDQAETLAEWLIADHALVDFNKSTSYNIAVAGNTSTLKSNGLDGQSINGKVNPFVFDGDTALGTQSGNVSVQTSNIGSFCTAVELESSVSDGRSSRIYSGLSTISSQINFRGVYTGGATTVASQLSFFGQFTVLLSLNTRGTNVWAISI
jgi:hypothetical protein